MTPNMAFEADVVCVAHKCITYDLPRRVRPPSNYETGVAISKHPSLPDDMASWLSRSLTRSYTSRIHRTTTSTNDFTHCVIGGGVVGLAVAARLAQIPNTTTILLERHRMVGTETSSRNSEVWLYGHCGRVLH